MNGWTYSDTDLFSMAESANDELERRDVHLSKHIIKKEKGEEKSVCANEEGNEKKRKQPTCSFASCFFLFLSFRRSSLSIGEGDGAGLFEDSGGGAMSVVVQWAIP